MCANLVEKNGIDSSIEQIQKYYKTHIQNFNLISLFMQNAKDYLIFAFTYNSFEAINPRLKFINTNVLEKMIWPGPNLFFLDCKM